MLQALCFASGNLLFQYWDGFEPLQNRSAMP